MRFQVGKKDNETLDVDLIKHTCSCNVWQLTGMPCIHAGPSVETLAATSSGTKSRFKFMETPGLKQQ
ncbi:hypothetical protein PIB30_114837 [Stylosanthes scabra]|uniref:SWIM-type domain-containing protein n=1 Tax=Stylosanthes scabra TaxID=79078 RepID=A0ABU6T210_9FABA|nr:hypothetical protein [Stylosanthes scabra]